jgi:UDP-N-acetylglucosamine:LPS N-acetylglucosamine transferase
MEQLSNKQYQIIKQTVGINYNFNQKGNFYRNHFVFDPREPWFHEVEALMAKGIAEELKPDITIPFFQLKLTPKGLNIATELETEIFNK